MADVSRRDRAQMVLITSLLIASVFVGLALVVNSAIYTENLATRETSSDTTESLEHVQLVERDLQKLVDRSNAAVTGDDYNAVKNGYESDLALWASSQERRYGATGRHVSYQQEYTTEGTRIQQTDIDRNFTAGGSVAGKDEWSPVNGTTEAGEFEMTIQRLSLLDATTATLDEMVAEAFNIVVENETGHQWRIYIFRGGSPDTGYVLVEEPGEDFSILDTDFVDYTTGACKSADGDVPMDLVNSSWGGAHCSELEFYTEDVIGTTHNISYRNTKTDGGALGIADPEDRVNGTYNITVDTRADRTPYYNPDSGDNPDAKAIIYEAAVSIEFRTRQTRHGNEDLSAKWSRVA